MTLLEMPAAAPARRTWERAVWPAGPIVEMLERRRISEGDLRKLDPPIHFKYDRERMTTTVVDEICTRVLGRYPTDFYGLAWLDAVPDAEQEELDLWAS